jgi:molybdopterin/thiamine biosynthesis adenylyltransferase
MSAVVAVVGVGGLGCPAAWALARAGVSLRLLDEDRVERSNLHRQMLFDEGDLGTYKVEAAARAIRRVAPSCEVSAVPEHVAPERVEALLGGATLVVEGSDNLPTRFLVADTCAALGIPVVHGGCVAWHGTVLPVAWQHGACYRCIYEELPPAVDACEAAGDCATVGVYGPVTSVIGALMAADALRLLSNDLTHAGSLLRYDGWRQRARATRFSRRDECPLCGATSAMHTRRPQ